MDSQDSALQTVTLVANVPLRVDGTVTASVPLGRGKFVDYTFTQDDATPGAPAICTTLPAAHAEYLQNTGNFLSPDEYAEELDFQRRAAERAAKRGEIPLSKRADTFVPGEELDDEPVDPMAAPVEGKAKPTGRVRKAS